MDIKDKISKLVPEVEFKEQGDLIAVIPAASFHQVAEALRYDKEDAFDYPISFNGKVRFKLQMPLTATNADIEAAVKAAPEAAKWTEGKTIRKIIIVPKKIVNIVIG